MKKYLFGIVAAVGVAAALVMGFNVEPAKAQTVYSQVNPQVLVASDDILGAEVSTQTAAAATVLLGEKQSLTLQATVYGISAACTNALTLSFDEAVRRDPWIVGNKTNSQWQSGSRTMTVTPLGTTTVNVISNWTGVAPRIRLFSITGDAVNSNTYIRLEALPRSPQ